MLRRTVTKLAGTTTLLSTAFAQTVRGRYPKPVQLIARFITQPFQRLPLGTDRARTRFKGRPRWHQTEPARPSTRDLLRLLQKEAATCEPSNLHPMRN